jgi:hypothetical protein
MRKKVFTTIFSSIALAVLLPATSLAASARTEVSGVVTSGSKAIAGAHVIVICSGNVKKTTTDNSGTYLVQYPIAKCPNQAIANVTATFGSKGGNNSGQVKNLTEKLNVAIVNVSVVPEFGLLTGAVATIAGGAGYLAIRRREAAVNYKA